MPKGLGEGVKFLPSPFGICLHPRPELTSGDARRIPSVEVERVAWRWPGLLGALLLATACQLVGGQASAPSVSSRLAYVGLDGQAYVLPVEGGDARRVSAVAGEAPVPAGTRFTRWPTWAPDGGRLAFMRYDVSR